MRTPWIAALLTTFTPAAGMAQSTFNPAFLSDDAAAVADLSHFEKGHRQPPGEYRVDIWRNNEFITTQDLRFVEQKEGSDDPAGTGLTPCLDVAWLQRLGLHVDAFPALKTAQPGECIALETTVPGTAIAFDFNRLRLDISFPQAAMHNSARGVIPVEEWDEGITAGLVNYTFTGNQGSDNDSYYMNLQSGLNIGPWRLRNNGAWSDNQGDGYHYRRWSNIGTWAQRTVVPLKSELVLGDSNTGSDVFDSMGFRGARMFSVDSMYPDSLQGYAPTVRGIARTNAKVVIRQNGYVIYQSYVTPGAFAIADLNPTSSSGDLDVTVEENNGSQQHYTVPYSTVPMLQREGRLKYELVAGNFRSGNSQQSTPFFSQGTLLAGLANGYTLYGGTQLGDGYHSFALGMGKNFGEWGAMSLDVTHARSQLADNSTHEGQSLRFLYAKSLSHFGTNFQLLGYRYSTQGFYTLDDVAYRKMEGENYQYDDPATGEPITQGYHNLHYSKKGRFQANISQQLGDYGSFYLSGSQQSYWGTGDTNTWYQLGYASGWRGISYSLSWSWSQTPEVTGTDKIAAFNLSIPFSALMGRSYSSNTPLERTYATLSASRNDEGNNSWQTGIGGTLLEGRNLSYSVTQGDTSSSGYSGSASANWQSAVGTFGLGYNYGRDRHETNWQMSGGVVAHADGVTFSQPLGSTNVLIKAPGAKNVRIENQTGVKTDWRGYTVMPYATVYRYNRIALDPNSMDDHTDVANNVSLVVPTEGALVRAEFDTHIGVRAMMTVKRGERPIPFGAIVREASSGVTSMAGEDGQIYLSGLPLQGTLFIVWGNGPSAQCHAPYVLPEASLRQAVVITAATCL